MTQTQTRHTHTATLHTPSTTNIIAGAQTARPQQRTVPLTVPTSSRARAPQWRAQSRAAAPRQPSRRCLRRRAKLSARAHRRRWRAPAPPRPPARRPRRPSSDARPSARASHDNHGAPRAPATPSSPWAPRRRHSVSVSHRPRCSWGGKQKHKISQIITPMVHPRMSTSAAATHFRRYMRGLKAWSPATKNTSG